MPTPLTSTDSSKEGTSGWLRIVDGMVLLVGGIAIFGWLVWGIVEMDDIAMTYGGFICPFLLPFPVAAAIVGWIRFRRGIAMYSGNQR